MFCASLRAATTIDTEGVAALRQAPQGRACQCADGRVVPYPKHSGFTRGLDVGSRSSICRPDPASRPSLRVMISKTQRLSLRVAIIAAEARAGAHTALLMDRILHGQDTDETEQVLCREMDVLAALRAHAKARNKDEPSP